MSMTHFDGGKMMQAATSAAGAASVPGIRAPRQLSPLAQLVAALPIGAAVSPRVVAGLLRRIGFGLIALVGVAADFGYVFPAYGHVFAWYSIGTAFGVAGLAMIAFQAADIYQIQAFRN